jgi:hypothetical protein
VNESTSARLRDRARDGADIEAIQIHSARGKDRSLEYHNAVSALVLDSSASARSAFWLFENCLSFFSLFSRFSYAFQCFFAHAERTKGAKGSVHVRR